MTDRALMLVMFVPTAVLLMLLALPLIRASVRPNWFYGFRVRATVNDPELWYPANVYAGKWLFGIGAALLLAAVALYFVRTLGDEAYVLTLAFGLVAAVLVMTVMCFVRLETLKRGRRDDDG